MQVQVYEPGVSAQVAFGSHGAVGLAPPCGIPSAQKSYEVHEWPVPVQPAMQVQVMPAPDPEHIAC